MHIVCLYLVSIKFLKFILRFWSNHLPKEWIFMDPDYGTFWHCMVQDNTITDICTKKRFWYHKNKDWRIEKNYYEHVMRKIKAMWNEILNILLSWSAESMQWQNVPWSLIRVQKDSLFRDGCSRNENKFMKVNRDQILKIICNKWLKQSFQYRKKLHRTKIGASNGGIYSLVAGITGDTVVIKITKYDH